jgi:hypothetical protein
VAIALILFYLPWANFPQPRFLRTVVLNVPTWGSGNEAAWSITPFFVPETVLVFILALVVLGMRKRWTPALPPGVGPLVWASGLMLIGGAVSLAASQFPGISIGGFAGRCTIFALAGVMVFSAPTPRAIKLWTYAAIAGTSLMCAVGLFYFYQSFGLPTTLSSLPLFRVSPGIANYELATYGFASNTVDLLILTAPTVMVLLVASSPSLRARAFLAVAGLLMYANLLISFERWAWVCLAASVLLTLLYYRHQKRGAVMLIVVSIAVVVLSAAAISQLGDYFQQALDPTSGSNILRRVQDWTEGISVLATNPAGVGLGMAGTLTALSDTSSHNLFIDIGVEGGVLALAGSLVWAGYHVRLLVRAIARHDPNDEWAFALLLGALMFVVYGMFFNSLLYFSGLMVWLAFWWCFPVMASAIASNAIRERAPSSSPVMSRLHVLNRYPAGTPDFDS